LPLHDPFDEPRTPHPEDLECVSVAFALTLQYLNDHQSRFDLFSARNYAAKIIMERALEGEHDTYRLWTAAVRALQGGSGYNVLSRRAEP
jgi:hypothetical protein